MRNTLLTVESSTTNRRLAEWRATWLIEPSASQLLLWCFDSFVLASTGSAQAEIRHCAKRENSSSNLK